MNEIWQYSEILHKFDYTIFFLGKNIAHETKLYRTSTLKTGFSKSSEEGGSIKYIKVIFCDFQV